MKIDCDVIRDLLPLYADDVCSGASRRMIDEHLQECADCSAVLEKIRSSEIESGLQEEKNQVLDYQARRFRRRSATVGSVVSSVFMIPVLVCLIVNLASGSALGWFFIVLAALAVAASLIVVPLMVPENKLFWTFCAFTVSVVVLLAVCCYTTRGSWFFVAASAVLFGLSLFCLPFVMKAKPVRELTAGLKRWPVVVTVDLILFANMMNMITLRSKSIFKTSLVLGLCAAGVWLLVNVIKEKRGETK